MTLEQLKTQFINYDQGLIFLMSLKRYYTKILILFIWENDSLIIHLIC